MHLSYQHCIVPRNVSLPLWALCHFAPAHPAVCRQSIEYSSLVTVNLMYAVCIQLSDSEAVKRLKQPEEETAEEGRQASACEKQRQLIISHSFAWLATEYALTGQEMSSQSVSEVVSHTAQMSPLSGSSSTELTLVSRSRCLPILSPDLLFSSSAHCHLCRNSLTHSLWSPFLLFGIFVLNVRQWCQNALSVQCAERERERKQLSQRSVYLSWVMNVN